MTEPKASRFPVPPIDSLPEDIRSRLLAVQEKSGFIPNVFLTLAFRPDEFRAFFAYHDALMEKDGGLTKAEREMIVVATSSANQCQYCVIAHGAILRIRAKNPLLADQVAVNYRKADITPRQHAMLDFAMKVSQEAQLVSEADFAALSQHGFSQDDIWDIAAIAAFKASRTSPSESFARSYSTTAVKRRGASATGCRHFASAPFMTRLTHKQTDR